MTMIDPCTNLVEIKRTLTTTAKEGAAAVENTWLARYPRPIKILTDQGPKFSSDFTNMCEKNGIRHNTSTSRNLQGNSLIEWTHQTIGQVLRSVVAAKNPKSIHEAETQSLKRHLRLPCARVVVCALFKSQLSFSWCCGIRT